MSSPDENEIVVNLRYELERLKADYDLLLQERNRISAEISSLSEALTDCQRIRAELEAALRRIRSSGELSATSGEMVSSRITFLEQEINSLSKTNSELEGLLFRSVMGEVGIKEKTREFILKQGSLKYRVLLPVSERGSIDINEIMRLTGLDQLTIRKAVEILSEERTIEVHGSQLTTSGGFRLPPLELWRSMPIDKIFEEVERYCITVRNPEAVVQALQALKDNLEEKVKIRGTVFFEIGKEIQEWKRGMGNLSPLQFKLRDWKSRLLM